MRKIVLIVTATALLLIAGCAGGSEDLSPDNLQDNNYELSGGYLSGEEIHYIYQRAFEALSWFNLTTMPGEWLGADGGVEMYGSTFDVRVAHDRISSLADLRAYLMEIFVEDYVDRLFADYVDGEVFRRFVDVDGVLHTIGGDRGTNATAGEIRYTVIRPSANEIIYQVAVDIHYWETPWEERSPSNAVDVEENSFVLINVDGAWLFTDFWLVV